MTSTPALALASLLLLGACAAGPDHNAAHAAHAGHMAQSGQADPATAAAAGHTLADDQRAAVNFPPLLRNHTLASMRDHLKALAEIQADLASGAFASAGQVAEQRLGMSSMALHGAHEVAAYMPAGMQAAGVNMHRAASQFAVVAQNASATGELPAALASLARLSQTCVACHSAYRLR